MSALESFIASSPSGEGSINPALAYELPAPSTAVVDRKQHCRAYPTSASSLTMSGTKNVRIRLGGEDFIDGSSVRLQYTIQALDGIVKAIMPLTGPWGVWQQAYCRSSGVELDNIPYYNRFHQQYGWNHLTREEQFGSVGIEGFHVAKARDENAFKPRVGILNKPFTVMHRLHFAILGSGKLIPTKYAPLEIELQMVNNVDDFLKKPTSEAEAAVMIQNFALTNVQILYDAYVLDEAVLSSFYSSLLRNKVMSIPLLSAAQIMHPLPLGATSFSLSSVRAFSRLAQVWVTFSGPEGSLATDFRCPNDLQGNNGDDTSSDLYLNAGSPPTARLSIGPKNWPDPQPIASAAEYYYMMIKALGTQPNISRQEFEHNAFTMAWDLRKNPGDSTTAISTRSGDQISIFLDNLNGVCNKIWVTCIFFGVCAIRESGVTLLT